ncbi:hypothetical protein ASE86_08625 [Sphingomonas sp. Leaf33]|uniref:hypothetical protein n=1 Tax=Sphingomonas sp. Leaf33 TaxID=1736215 RepID=UPI0006F43988|nr:hypothetical protein [Sphingomonas sp. Leaf33]KQN26201.1 hypothetical protein ASE86_08625 [Sphingomonas sp. Leaf33]
MPTRIPARTAIALILAVSAAFPTQSAQIVAPVGQPAAPYAAVAGRVLEAPLLIDATIRDAQKLKPAEALDVRPGFVRFYVVADVGALIRGPAQVSAQVAYLADLPLDARGKAPRLKKARVLLFARGVPGRPGEIQLIGANGQQPWTPALDAQVRGIAREVVATDAPPEIRAVGNAFHVAGSLPGEGETQIFLTTADGRPVSLSILRRPGEQPRWAVALSEIVDEAAAPPPRDTLLWYRLACGLPQTLPDRSVAAMEPADAAIAREDYAFVLSALGPCTR